MENSDVQFDTKFRLDLTPNRTVEIYDTIDYSGLGEDINDFVGIVKVSGPSGVIYENTDFNNPDIVPGTSRQMTTLIYLILDPLNDYQVMKGQYTIKYSVKDTVSENTYENSNVYGFHFDNPTMAVNVDSGPYSAKLRSNDNTDYGSDISLLTREHRIQYPTDLSLPDIVTTLASYEVDPIYTNEWTIIVTSVVDYKQGDDLEYRWGGTQTVTHCVTGACISSFYSSVDEMLTMYRGYIGVNPSRAGVFRERLQQINTAWQLLDIAWMYVDLEEADRQAETIREIIEKSDIDMCPSGSSVQVDACPEWGGGQGGGFYTEGTGIDIDVQGKVISLTDYGELKISADDTTMGFIEDKFTVSHGGNVTNILELTTLSPGGGEIRQLQLDESKISHDSIGDVSADDHHNQAHILATSGDHTGALPLTDLDNYAVGALMYGGAADWAVLGGGTEDYVLKMGATYPEWSSSGGAHGDHTGHVTSVGLGTTTLTVSAITGQAELTSGLVNTDELVLSDAGVIKRMDISVLQTYMQDNLNFTTGGFWTVTGDDIYNNNSGNVGIGAAPGAYKFDVTGTVRVTGNLFAEANVQNSLFSSGWFGSNWQITSAGDEEVENILVRGAARFRELIIDQLSIIAGTNLMSIARGKVASINTGESKITLEDPNNKGTSAFAVNDFFWIKAIDINKAVFSDCRGQITAITGLTLTLNFAVAGGNGAITDVAIGDVITQRGHPTNTDRQAMIYTTVSDSDGPFRRVLTGVDSLAAFTDLDNVGLQDGNLENLASYGIVPASPGFGSYSDNVYLTGKIIISNPGDINTSDLNNDAGFTDDTAADAAQADATTALGLIPNDADGLIDRAATPDGAGLYLGSTHLGYYNGGAWKTYMASNGDFFLSGTSGYLTWDSSEETLTIKGTVNASDGNIGGWDLSSNSIHHGAEKLTDGYATPGTATFMADGSLHLPNFYVNAEGGPNSGQCGLREVIDISFVGFASQKIKVTGREIREDGANFDSGYIYINMFGYQGGSTKYRSTTIGSGKGNPLLIIKGEDNNQQGTVTINAQPNFGNVPTSPSGLNSGDIWNDSGTLKIVT